MREEKQVVENLVPEESQAPEETQAPETQAPEETQVAEENQAPEETQVAEIQAPAETQTPEEDPEAATASAEEPEESQPGRKKIKKKRKAWQPRAVGYRRFATEAVLRIWQYRMFTGVIVTLPTLVLDQLLYLTASSTGTALTTADFRKFLGWRGPAVLVLLLMLYGLHLVIEVFAQIYLCDDILNGGRSTSIRD